MPVMLRFALPMFLATALQQGYNIADTAIVGHFLGSNALAAVGATSALYSLLVYFASGVSNGSSIIAAQVFGEMGKKGRTGTGAADADSDSYGDGAGKMRRAVSSLCVINAATALCLTAVSLPLLMTILRALGTPAAIVNDAHSYIFIVMSALTATVAYNASSGFLRAVGNSAAPLVFLTISCVLNVILDIALIGRFGVAGAAYATVASQAVSAIVCIAYICKNYKPFLPRGRGDLPRMADIKGMAGTSLSMGLMLSVFSIGSIILQSGINGLGTMIIASHTVSRRIYELLMMPMGTLSAALSTFIAQNYGANEHNRIKTAMRQSIMSVAVWSVFCTVVGFATGGMIARFLSGDGGDAVIANAVLNLRVSLLFFFPLGMLLLLRNALQSLGHKVWPLVSSTTELVMKIAFCAFVVPRMGYIGVVATEPATWVVCGIMLFAVWGKVTANNRCMMKCKAA